MVSVNQESSGTLTAAATNKHACHSLQIGNLVIVVWLIVVILLFCSKKYYYWNSFFEDGRRFRYFRLLQFEQWPLRYCAELFAGIRCVFNRNNLAFFSSFRGSNIGNSCICHFIFIFPGYSTNKFNDQLPVTWLAEAKWLEPCLGIAIWVNPGKPPIFFRPFFSQLHKLRL